MQVVGGRGNYEGTVAVIDSAGWGTICDEHFTDSDATVLCKMLGFTSGFEYIYIYFEFEQHLKFT